MEGVASKLSLNVIYERLEVQEGSFSLGVNISPGGRFAHDNAILRTFVSSVPKIFVRPEYIGYHFFGAFLHKLDFAYFHELLPI